MLKLDLARLARKGRIRIDAVLPADDPVLEPVGLALANGLEIRLEAQRAGPDVVVRGGLHGEIMQVCRRCLRDVGSELSEEVTFLYRPGVSVQEAEDEAVYRLVERSGELDLGPAVREHLMLAVPQYPVCAERCRGLCPRCGADLNRGPCDCVEERSDPRWGALGQLAN